MLDKLLLVALVLSGLTGAHADVYINNPRGSDNKLSEQADNAQNHDRLFDSQNNAAGGYQIGDNCKPVCQDHNRNYNASQDEAIQGAMTYYQGSELYIEWFMQHGCGAGHPNVRCQAILQGRALVEKFAFLGQKANVQCDPAENNDQKVAKCKQLNGASAYFDGDLVRMRQVGEHHVLSTRNSDFSNRSHKATIRVTRRWWAWYSGLAVEVGALAVCTIVVYLLAAGYPLKHPTSWMFSARYRPRVLAFRRRRLNKRTCGISRSIYRSGGMTRTNIPRSVWLPSFT